MLPTKIMQIKLIWQNPLARNFPQQLTNKRASTLRKVTTPLTVNRSPHIDKKSREQFKFFRRRSIIIQKIKKIDYHSLLSIVDLLKHQFAYNRLSLQLTITEQFKTTF